MHIQCVQAQHLSTGTRIGQTNLLRWVHRTEQNIFSCHNNHTFSVHNEHNWRATRKALSMMNAGGIALNYYKWHLWITTVLSARFPFQPNLATTTLKPSKQQGTRSGVHVSFIAFLVTHFFLGPKYVFRLRYGTCTTDKWKCHRITCIKHTLWHVHK